MEETVSSRVRLIAGLGNPGRSYHRTRHNIGFMVVDALAAARSVSIDRIAGGGRIADIRVGGTVVRLLKPMTFMNRSGDAVAEQLVTCGISCGEMVVIHDDIDLAFGRLKIKKKGGDGGHKGIRSIMDACGSGDFIRLRIGIGRSEIDDDVVDHVLGAFDEHESTRLPRIIEQARDAVTAILHQGVGMAMNRFNRKESPTNL